VIGFPDIGKNHDRAPELVSGAEAKHPPRKRKIKMEAVFLDKAQPIWKPIYTTKVPMNIGRRPYASDSGPQRRGPIQYPATKREMVRTPTSWLKPKAFSIWLTIPDGAEEAKVELRTRRPAMEVRTHR